MAGLRQPNADDYLLVGTVIAPFGLKGEVKVRVVTDFPERFVERPLYVGTAHDRYTVRTWRPHGADVAVLALERVESRADAEALRDADLYARIADVTPLPHGAYYVHDIVGLTAVTDDGRVIGPVTEVLPTGSNDVYIVAAEHGREVLVPAIKQVVTAIDVPGGRIVIHPTEGLDL